MVQFQLVIDDGENLQQLTTDPVHVTAADWGQPYFDMAAAEMKQLEAQLNAPPTTE